MSEGRKFDLAERSENSTGKRGEGRLCEWE